MLTIFIALSKSIMFCCCGVLGPGLVIKFLLKDSMPPLLPGRKMFGFFGFIFNCFADRPSS